jgi:hypothetical protein
MNLSRYVIVRCRDAGVHAGVLEGYRGREVTLSDSRRLWHWSGAASLSEIAVHGADPSASQFAVAVEEIVLLEACEIIACSQRGEEMIRTCPEWRPDA